MIEELVCFKNYGFIFGLFFFFRNCKCHLGAGIVIFDFFFFWPIQEAVYINLLAIIKIIITKLLRIIFQTFESDFDMMSSCVLNSYHVNKPLILFLFAMNNFLDKLFFGLIKNFALSIIAWIWQITVRWFVNKDLAKFISYKTLLRLEKSYYSTHLESFTLYELMKIKLSL